MRLSLNRYYLFIGLAISVSLVASFIAHAGGRFPLATGASLDLMLTVPAAWYWLLVRPGLRSKGSLAVVAALGLWRASFLFPQVVPGKFWIGAGMELALITAAVAGLRNATGSDPVDRLYNALARFTPSKTAAKAIAAELSVFYYGFAWKAKPHVLPGMRAFSLHERSGTSVLMGCMAVVSLLEIVPVHVFLAYQWSTTGSTTGSTTAAWVATGLSIWGAVWMMAMGRAFALRPTLVGADRIILRFGLLFKLEIPAERILSIEPGCAMPADTRVLPKDTSPSHYIRFTEPLDAGTILGFTRRLTAIGVSADDSAGFASALSELKKPAD